MTVCFVCNKEIQANDEVTVMTDGKNECPIHTTCFKIKDAEINAEIHLRLPRTWDIPVPHKRRFPKLW